MPSAWSTFPTTHSGTICGNIPSTKHRKILDSDQLAPKHLKTQGKASDDNNNDPDDNDYGTDNDEGLVPMKGGRGGHKAHKQKNWENPTKQKCYDFERVMLLFDSRDQKSFTVSSRVKTLRVWEQISSRESLLKF